MTMLGSGRIPEMTGPQDAEVLQGLFFSELIRLAPGQFTISDVTIIRVDGNASENWFATVTGADQSDVKNAVVTVQQRGVYLADKQEEA